MMRWANRHTQAVPGEAAAKGVRIASIRILTEAGSVFRITDSTDVTIEKAAYPEGADVFLTLSGAKTSDIRLLGTDVSRAKKDISLEKAASLNALSSR